MVATIVSILVMIAVAFLAALLNIILCMGEESYSEHAAAIIMEEYEGYTEGV